jgi:hypothetical protein
MSTSKPLKCKKCGCQRSVFMGEESNRREMCQNCLEIEKMQKAGALAKNGLCTLDLM